MFKSVDQTLSPFPFLCFFPFFLELQSDQGWKACEVTVDHTGPFKNLMDPLSITTATIGFIGLCAGLVKTIRAFIEQTKSTKAMLIQLVDRIEHMRMYLANLRSLTGQMTDPAQRKMVIPFDRDSCNITIRKLQALVQRIAQAGEAGKIKATITWLQEEKEVEKLTDELLEEERKITTVLMFIAA